MQWRQKGGNADDPNKSLKLFFPAPDSQSCTMTKGGQLASEWFCVRPVSIFSDPTIRVPRQISTCVLREIM